MALRIPKRAVLERWDTLPEEIRDAMTSDASIDALDRIYAQLHIPDDKQKIVARLAGYVFLGFLHADDISRELEEALAMNSQHARELGDAINQSVFKKYKEALEKMYSPDFSQVKPTETPAPMRIAVDSVAAPKPKTASVQAPSVAPVPMPLAQAAASVPAPTAPTAAAPSAAQAKPAPAPFMIHEEAKATPLAQAPKFSVSSFSASGSAFQTAKPMGAVPTPPRPAQIEIGAEEKPKPVEKVSRIETPTRVIHYSSLYTPIGEQAGRPGAPVSIGAISSAVASPMQAASKTIPPASPSPSPLPSKISPFINAPLTPPSAKSSAPIQTATMTPAPASKPVLPSFMVKPATSAAAKPDLSAKPVPSALTSAPAISVSVRPASPQPPAAPIAPVAAKPEFGNFLKNMVSPAPKPAEDKKSAPPVPPSPAK